MCPVDFGLFLESDKTEREDASHHSCLFKSREAASVHEETKVSLTQRNKFKFRVERSESVCLCVRQSKTLNSDDKMFQ